MADRPNLALALAIALTSSACATLTPTVPEPQPQLPADWQGAAANGTRHAADIGWEEFVLDTRLETLLAQAIANNRDLRVAMLNIERARALYRIQRADRLPGVAAGVQGERSGGQDIPDGRNYSASVGVSAFELDVWGRVRNLGEAALQRFFAQEENSRAVQVSLVSAVSNTFIALAADQDRLRIAGATLRIYEESLRLAERRHTIGVISGLELAQARTQVASARADVATYRGQVAQDRTALQLLVGQPLDPALLPERLTDSVATVAEVPAGVPSDILLRRPDLRAAERVLMAANANIGAARAALLPTISLTGNVGQASTDLAGLFDGGVAWSFVPRVSIPIFNAGRLRANVEVASADRDIALANYEHAIQAAFKDVADGLALSSTLSERVRAQEELVSAARRSDTLSQARYRAGYDSYLVRLDAQRTLYGAEMALLAARQAEQANRVALYGALGGGWQRESR